VKITNKQESPAIADTSLVYQRGSASFSQSTVASLIVTPTQQRIA